MKTEPHRFSHGFRLSHDLMNARNNHAACRARPLQTLGLIALVSAAFAATTPVHALTINLTPDSSLGTYLSPTDVTSAENAFNYAAQQFQLNFSDPININIIMAADPPGDSTIGRSHSVQLPGSYNGVRLAFTNDNTLHPSSDGTTSLSCLPGSDPTGGTGFYLTRAQEKAIGTISNGSTDLTNDGTFTFGSGRSFTFDQNNRAVSGKYDFIGIAEHEISEIMGRIEGLGANISGQTGASNYLPYDLFRYTAANTRGLTAGNGIYFSIDNGTTNLKAFNFPNGNGSDAQDWASGTNDAYNALETIGVKNDLSAVDFTALDVIGYDRTAAIPEPRTSLLLAAGFGLSALLRRRR